MHLSWLSLLPPFMVIIAVFFTHQLNISLAIGIAIAALIATHGHLLPAITMCSQKLITHFSDIDNIYLYLLLIAISSLITLLTVTGAAAGCARIIGKKMKTKRSVETSTILLSTLLSLDDYLSILTVGFVMRPIADRLAVARTKLAYIVHALAGPLVIIMPISTWAAAVLAQLDNAGLSTDSFYVYFKTIPFIFYSLLIVFSVWLVVVTRISFGLIARDEQHAMPIQDVDESEKDFIQQHSLFELLLPIGLLITTIFMGILYAGNYYLFGGNNSFADAFRNNDKTFLIFLCAGLVAFTCSLGISLYKHMIRLQQIPAVVYEGFLLIRSSIVMIMLAAILGNFLRLELHTGNYIAHMFLGTIPLYLIPVILYVVSLVITLTMGSAWGTFSLLIPIAIQMLFSFLQLDSSVALDQVQLLYPALGAVLSGAACGNHISPLAETTVMTATSTGIQPLEHARTQFPYAVPVIIGTFASYIASGMLYNTVLYINFLISFGVGVVVCTVLLFVGKRFFR
jgi:tetracycline resistance efflux pump